MYSEPSRKAFIPSMPTASLRMSDPAVVSRQSEGTLPTERRNSGSAVATSRVA